MVLSGRRTRSTRRDLIVLRFCPVALPLKDKKCDDEKKLSSLLMVRRSLIEILQNKAFYRLVCLCPRLFLFLPIGVNNPRFCYLRLTLCSPPLSIQFHSPLCFTVYCTVDDKIILARRIIRDTCDRYREKSFYCTCSMFEQQEPRTEPQLNSRLS